MNASATLAAQDEVRLRRAVRFFVMLARQEGGADDAQYGFDLLQYLRPDARAIVDDETTRALEGLVCRD